MTISVVIFALLAGLIIGLVGAVLVIVVCVGFALIILLPTLFITTAAATFIWLWGMAGYWIVKHFNQKDIPGIHTDLKGGIKGQLGSVMAGDEGVPPATHEDGEEEGGKKENGGLKEQKSGGHGNVNGSADNEGKSGSSTGVDVGNPKEAADIGKHAGKATNAAKGITG